MKILLFIGSCLMLTVSVLMAAKQIKEKKRITDPYLLLSILTFIIALRMVGRMLGISF